MIENDEILDGLTKIENKINEISSDATVSKKAFNDEISRLGAEQLKLAKSLADLEQKGVSAPEIVKDKPQSLGENFVKSASFNSFGENRRAQFEFKKAATTSANAFYPQGIPGIVSLPDQALNVEPLFPHVPVSSGSVQYVVAGAMTNNAAVVAEASNKPETTFAQPTLATANVVTVAHWTRITNQLASDAPALSAYINQKLIYGLSAKIDDQLINGTGSATTLPGLLKAGNYTDVSQTIQPLLPSGADLYDYALYLKSHLESANIVPEVLLLNPSDWTALCVLKDKQGRYLMGGPQVVASKTLWGIRVVTSAAVPAGKFIMANLTLGATIYDREALSLAMSESDGTNFTQNLITLRVERRLAVAVELPAAILGGDWEVPVA